MSVQNKGKVFNTDLIFTLEMEFMADVAKAVVHSALTRKESRGSAFPHRYHRARRRKLAQAHACLPRHWTAMTACAVETSPVTITKWEPVKRVY